MWKRGSGYRVLVGKSEGKKHLEVSDIEHNNYMGLQEVG
jgi:hypothetical protein